MIGSVRDRPAARLPRIEPMNRAISPSPGPSGHPLPRGEGESVRPSAAGSRVKTGGNRRRTFVFDRWFWTFLVFFLAPSIAHAEYWVQVGVFYDKAQLDQASKDLRRKTYPVATQLEPVTAHRSFTRLLVGPYSNRAAAEQARVQLLQLGWHGFLREAPMAARAGRPAAPATGSAPPKAAELPAAVAKTPAAVGTKPESVDSLFGAPVAGTPPSAPAAAAPSPRRIAFSGFYLFDAAYTLPDPAHGSKFRNLLDLGARGAWGQRVKWKLSGRVAYDAIYDLNNFYAETVRNDARFEALIDETFFDISAGNTDFRIGRQNVVWGEMVGLFLADVVSAKDLREFVAQDFDLIRIPQWAVRSEYFKNDFHGEFVWIPYMTYDNIGVPGSEFYPYPPPPPPGNLFVINKEQRPPDRLDNAAYGLRGSYLVAGWDTALFYYTSMGTSATFIRQIVPGAYIYTPTHQRIRQTGFTTSKGFSSMVFKTEAVYTRGRDFNVSRVSEPSGVVPQDFLDYAFSFEFSLAHETTLNLQGFQRIFFNHDPDNYLRASESGAGIYLSSKFFSHKMEPSLLMAYGINHHDSMWRPSVTWHVDDHWTASTGADFFSGPMGSAFGRYGDHDRVYVNCRYQF